MVYVDVKHHVYLLAGGRGGATMGQTFLFLGTKSPILCGQIYKAKIFSCTSTMGCVGGGGGDGVQWGRISSTSGQMFQ